MKKITAFILLIPMLAQLGSRYLVMLNFEVNKQMIAQTLCVNRDKPMSGCNGKCYLKKQLDKAAKQENAPNNNTRDNSNELLFFTDAKKLAAYFLAEESDRQYFSSRQPFTPQNLYGSVFHPPQKA
jgi:hypothetical protein